MIKPTIIQLCDSPFVGGPEKQILGQCMRVDRSCFDFLVVSFAHAGNQENSLTTSARSFGLRATCLKDGKLMIPSSAARLCTIIKRNQSPLIISHGFRANFIAYLASLSTKVPFVSYFHGRTGATAAVRFYERLDTHIMRRARAVVAVCEQAAEDLRSAGIRRVRVIHNAVDMADVAAEGSRVEARDELGLRDDELAVGAVGRLSVEKGHIHLLEAAREVLQEWPNCKFFLIGDGPMRGALEEKAKVLEISEQVQFVGFRPDAVALMKALDVFALPSLTENLPISLLEAMACGISTVAADVGGVREVLIPAGVEPVPPKCPDSLAHAILSLLKSDRRRAEMGATLKLRVEDFSFERQAAQIENLLTTCIGSDLISTPRRPVA